MNINMGGDYVLKSNVNTKTKFLTYKLNIIKKGLINLVNKNQKLKNNKLSSLHKANNYLQYKSFKLKKIGYKLTLKGIHNINKKFGKNLQITVPEKIVSHWIEKNDLSNYTNMNGIETKKEIKNYHAVNRKYLLKKKEKELIHELEWIENGLKDKNGGKEIIEAHSKKYNDILLKNIPLQQKYSLIDVKEYLDNNVKDPMTYQLKNKQKQIMLDKKVDHKLDYKPQFADELLKEGDEIIKSIMDKKYNYTDLKENILKSNKITKKEVVPQRSNGLNNKKKKDDLPNILL